MNLRPPADVATAPSASLPGLVDDELDRFLRGEQDRLSPLAPEALVLLDEVVRLVRAGGKRLRPLFAYWGYRAGGADDLIPAGDPADRTRTPAIVRAGAALELLHACALIHDDVMDRSPWRRGHATTFRRLAKAGVGGDRFGRSAAILAGDLALALADELLLTSGFPASRVLAAFSHFNRMRVEAVGGQFLDLLSPWRSAGDESAARRAARLKSGSYSVVGPLLVGAALAGAPEQIDRSLRLYGRPLGEAFQLRDDVLGTFGDPSLTGKDADTDLREGKRTALVAKAWQMGSPDVRALIAERLGRPNLSPGEVRELREAIRASGALAETIGLIDSLAGQAKEAVRASGIDSGIVGALEALADRVAVRDA